MKKPAMYATIALGLIAAVGVACGDSDTEPSDSPISQVIETSSAPSPAPPTEVARPAVSTPTKLEPGSTAVLVHPTASGISLRLAPSQTSVTFGRMNVGSVVVITRGAQVAEGVEWCQFQAGDVQAWTECRFLQAQ